MISSQGLLQGGESSLRPPPRSLSLTSSSDSDSGEEMDVSAQAAASLKGKGHASFVLSSEAQVENVTEANARPAEGGQNEKTPTEASATPPIVSNVAASTLNVEDCADPANADRFVSGLLNSDNTDLSAQS